MACHDTERTDWCVSSLQVVQRLEAEASVTSREEAAAHATALQQLKAEHAASLDEVRPRFNSAYMHNLPACHADHGISQDRYFELSTGMLRMLWPLMQARGSQQRYAGRHRETAAALVAAQDRADAAAAQVLELRKDSAAKNETITWLEGQVQSAQQVRAMHRLRAAHARTCCECRHSTPDDASATVRD